MQGKKICDMHKCSNEAKFSMKVKGFFKKEVCLCEDCVRQTLKTFLGESVPKAISSPFKPNSRIKKEKK